MKKIYLLIPIYFIFSCEEKVREIKKQNSSKPIYSQKKSENELDTKLKVRTSKQTNNFELGKLILVSAGQMRSSKEIKLLGCDFDVVILGENDTVYLTTNDKKFVTPEKISVGMKFSEIPENLREKINKENGWGYFIELDSKWCIGFCEGTSCTDKSISENSEIKWIFKRK